MARAVIPREEETASGGGIHHSQKPQGGSHVYASSKPETFPALQLGSQHHFVDGIPRMYDALPKLANLSVEKYNSSSPRVAIG